MGEFYCTYTVKFYFNKSVCKTYEMPQDASEAFQSYLEVKRTSIRIGHLDVHRQTTG